MSRSEGIDITEDAARIIARISRGGMRDAISLLELCAGAHTRIDDDLVFSTVGSGNRDSAYKLIEAVGRSDFSAVYEIINDIVMKSGDVSVFWQEIIESYRDIMVVKNSESAKRYLDLTDVEYAQLSKTAAQFTMARLYYHVTLLEEAMADMQRAFNSKRSIAEIALTRMCDPKLTSSAESLAVRIEELEKEVSMLRLGVPVAPSPKKEERIAEIKKPTEKAVEAAKPQSVTTSSAPELYPLWGSVIERIRELKRSLASGIASATVYRAGENKFTVKLSDFFAKKLASDEADFAIVRGVIAQIEGKNPAEIVLHIESANKPLGTAFSEIENALK